jgi:hypothetical protein
MLLAVIEAMYPPWFAPDAPVRDYGADVRPRAAEKA